jgi:arylsulfatase
MAVNFVNPHDIMSFDYGGVSEVQLPPNLAHAVVTKPPADVPLYRAEWDVELPMSVHDDLAAPAAVREYAAVSNVAFGPVSGDEAWRAGLNFYLNCLRDVDRSVELVLDALTASGQADSTVVEPGAPGGGVGVQQQARGAHHRRDRRGRPVLGHRATVTRLADLEGRRGAGSPGRGLNPTTGTQPLRHPDRRHHGSYTL